MREIFAKNKRNLFKIAFYSIWLAVLSTATSWSADWENPYPAKIKEADESYDRARYEFLKTVKAKNIRSPQEQDALYNEMVGPSIDRMNRERENGVQAKIQYYREKFHVDRVFGKEKSSNAQTKGKVFEEASHFSDKQPKPAPQPVVKKREDPGITRDGGPQELVFPGRKPAKNPK